jgi:hypothetical protein
LRILDGKGGEVRRGSIVVRGRSHGTCFATEAAMASSTVERAPHNKDQDLPRRRGELIDDDRDKVPERDKTPDTPPTEPPPIPVREPPPVPEQQGPYIAG